MKAFAGVFAIILAAVLLSWFLKWLPGGMLKCNFTDTRVVAIPCVGLASAAVGAFAATSGMVLSWTTKRGRQNRS